VELQKNLRLIKRFFYDPNGLVRIIKRYLTKWNPGMLDGGRIYKMRYVAVPLYRIFGAIIPNNKSEKFHSFHGEDEYISDYLKHNGEFTLVDIGCGDGFTMSNLARSIHSGEVSAILVEGNGLKFSQLAVNYANNKNVTLIRSLVTPENVSSIVDKTQMNTPNYILSLDIDTYDLFVAKRILETNPPSLMCLEWNPLFEPPIEFTVNPNYKSGWRGDWFWGASIETWNKMLNAFNFGIVKVYGVSFFAEPRSATGVYLTSQEAYDNFLSQKNRPFLPSETKEPGYSENLTFIKNLLEEYTDYFTSSISVNKG